VFDEMKSLAICITSIPDLTTVPGIAPAWCITEVTRQEKGVYG